jgi:hypothetical protein
MNKLDKAYNQLKELSNNSDYHHYLHNKYYSYKQQLKTINNKLDKEMAHIQDNRTPEQHFMDICRGWLVEDVFTYLFSLPPYKELTSTFDNHDQDRIIRVMRREITAAPDFKVTYRNKTIKIEVQSLFADIPFFHIKEHKAKKLTHRNSFLIQFNIPHRQIVVFEPHQIELGTYRLIEDFSTDTIKKYGYKYIIDDLPEEMIVSNFVDKLPKKIISLFS